MDIEIAPSARDWLMERGGEVSIYTPMFGGG